MGATGTSAPTWAPRSRATTSTTCSRRGRTFSGKPAGGPAPFYETNKPKGIYLDSGANGVSLVGNTMSNIDGDPIFIHDVGKNCQNGMKAGTPHDQQFLWNPLYRMPADPADVGLRLDKGADAPNNATYQSGLGMATDIIDWSYLNTYDGGRADGPGGFLYPGSG